MSQPQESVMTINQFLEKIHQFKTKIKFKRKLLFVSYFIISGIILIMGVAILLSALFPLTIATVSILLFILELTFFMNSIAAYKLYSFTAEAENTVKNIEEAKSEAKSEAENTVKNIEEAKSEAKSEAKNNEPTPRWQIPIILYSLCFLAVMATIVIGIMVATSTLSATTLIITAYFLAILIFIANFLSLIFFNYNKEIILSSIDYSCDRMPSKYFRQHVKAMSQGVVLLSKRSNYKPVTLNIVYLGAKTSDGSMDCYADPKLQNFYKDTKKFYQEDQNKHPKNQNKHSSQDDNSQYVIDNYPDTLNNYTETPNNYIKTPNNNDDSKYTGKDTSKKGLRVVFEELDNDTELVFSWMTL